MPFARLPRCGFPQIREFAASGPSRRPCLARATAERYTHVMNSDAALVLFSGGQDSTTCLAWALTRFARVETVGFDYGQRHAAELKARGRVIEGMRDGFPAWSARLGADTVLTLDVLKQIGGSALTDAMSIEMGRDGLPTSFVPGRNVLFLTAAAALGYRRGIADLVGGMCETDFSGYPDCREKTIAATAEALTLALARRVTVHTPLMAIDKAATWKLAEELGGKTLVDLIREETVTCYEGDRTYRHEWGYGCGTCPACDLRAKGYAKYVST
jgi:7-cyano-7-deazaguanine synthase